jgi:hypothetical protein
VVVVVGGCCYLHIFLVHVRDRMVHESPSADGTRDGVKEGYGCLLSLLIRVRLAERG